MLPLTYVCFNLFPGQINGKVQLQMKFSVSTDANVRLEFIGSSSVNDHLRLKRELLSRSQLRYLFQDIDILVLFLTSFS